MVNSVDFIKRLEKILAFYSLSAAAFAEEIEFSRSSISHLLSGRNKPSLEFVMKILNKFPEVEMQWLLFGKGIFPSHATEKILADPPTEKPLNLFSEKNELPKSMVPKNISNSKEVDSIVIFYKDGSFNLYKN